MLKIFSDSEGRVLRIVYDEDFDTGDTPCLMVERLPEEPMRRDGFGNELVVKDGALQWVSFKLEEQQEPEPPPAPTHEEIEQARAAAYRATVDPITCEIARLRDMGGTDEEIAEAEARRAEAVAAVKSQYPYPEEE